MAAPAFEPGIARLTAKQVKERLDKGEECYFVDVRRHPDDSQIKGATYYDPESILAADHVDLPVSRDCLIITYCTWRNEGTSARVALKLAEQGYKNVYPLLGGFEGWRTAGYPVERRRS